MSYSEEIPTLRVVALNDLVLHEETDPQRVEGLVVRIREDGLLKNPPVVVPISDADRYVVLDGANRTAALRALGLRDAVVQVVDYSKVQLDTWNHLVTGIDKQVLFEAMKRIPGLEVEPSDVESARRLLAAREILAYIVCSHGGVHLVGHAGTLAQGAERLLQLSKVYKGQATIYRVQIDDMEELLSYYDDVAAVVIYPPFRPTDIIELASNSAKLPTGITRHIIPRRALRINIHLELLAAGQPLDEKNAWLRAWLRRKLQNKEVRFYQEPTFLFDE